ncbi:uncharacterized protein LOC135177782 [Pogoniulus pusillus]|uniref:uncharacterized protein LOC135177782 n=1 Tax=Pogoniulus pusillus TaxID=488313 RepID=UPI0030B92A99
MGVTATRPSLSERSSPSFRAAPGRQLSVLVLPKPKFILLISFPPQYLSVFVHEVEVSQHGDRAESHHLLVLPGLRRTEQPQRGPGRAREGPLGAVLTPQERALLHAADPAPRRLTAEQGELGQPPAPPRGPGQQLQELLEAHQRHVAEIRARTQELEQQREGLCQRLAALGSRAAVNTHPEQGQLETDGDREALQDRVRQIALGG